MRIGYSDILYSRKNLSRNNACVVLATNLLAHALSAIPFAWLLLNRPPAIDDSIYLPVIAAILTFSIAFFVLELRALDDNEFHLVEAIGELQIKRLELEASGLADIVKNDLRGNMDSTFGRLKTRYEGMVFRRLLKLAAECCIADFGLATFAAFLPLFLDSANGYSLLLISIWFLANGMINLYMSWVFIVTTYQE